MDNPGNQKGWKPALALTFVRLFAIRPGVKGRVTWDALPPNCEVGGKHLQV
jgi:hypothetical protein